MENKIIHNKNQFTESIKLNLDTTKIYKKIGWKSKLNFSQTCEFICSWYLNYFKNKKNILKFTESQIKNILNKYSMKIKKVKS